MVGTAKALSPMNRFMAAHPCEVWRGDEFIARFTNVYTACQSAMETGPSCTVVTPHETLQPWDVRELWAKGRQA